MIYTDFYSPGRISWQIILNVNGIIFIMSLKFNVTGVNEYIFVYFFYYCHPGLREHVSYFTNLSFSEGVVYPILWIKRENTGLRYLPKSLAFVQKGCSASQNATSFFECIRKKPNCCGDKCPFETKRNSFLRAYWEEQRESVNSLPYKFQIVVVINYSGECMIEMCKCGILK